MDNPTALRRRIIEAAISAPYGTAVGCLGGIAYTLIDPDPNRKWAAVAGFALGTIAGAIAPFLIDFLISKKVVINPAGGSTSA